MDPPPLLTPPLRGQVDQQLRRVQLRRFMLHEEVGSTGSTEEHKQLEEEEEALAEQQRELSRQLSAAVEAYHRGFHQDWGQPPTPPPPYPP